MGALTRTFFLALVVASMTACAALKPTLAQDLAHERFQQCSDQFPHMRLERIDPDGQIWARAADGGFGQWEPWRACLREAALRQRRMTAGTTVAPEPRVSGAAAIAPTAPQPPVWKVGDEWAYRYDGSTGAGTYVWAVVRSEVMDGFDCYVIKTGEREIFYRKQDLASVRELVSGVVVRRDVPPRPHYQWPLTVGSKWQQELTLENWRDRQTTSLSFSWEVVATEGVTVPAGTFKTLKIVSRNERTNRRVYEMWYAPDVKQFVKIHEWRDSGEQTRELIAYKLR